MALQVEQLLDRDLAETDGPTVCVPWENYGTASEQGLSLTARFIEQSPFLLSVDRISDLGRRDFEYAFAFLLGGREVTVERVGYFVRHRVTGRIFELDPSTYRLVDAMSRHNGTPPGERSSASVWGAFAEVRDVAEGLGVRLDEHLAANRVIVPSSIVLEFELHDDGSLSFVPRCPELAADDFATVFKRNRNAERVYSMDGGDGARIRILLNERQHAVLERMKRVQRVQGEARAHALRTPEAYFDGVLEDVEIRYGSRVTGVGELTFASTPPNPNGPGVLKALLGDADPSRDQADGADCRQTSDKVPDDITRDPDRMVGPQETSAEFARVSVPRADGDGRVELRFASASALSSFRERLARALARGEEAIDHEGVEVAVDRELLDVLNRPMGRGSTGRGAEAGKKYLLIYTNEEDLVERDVTSLQGAIRDMEGVWPKLPKSLAPNVKLKKHQEDGIAWLGRCASLAPARRGALLADDMGLGKTLQILTHLASSIESGGLKSQQEQGEEAPWHPILIVAPLMLVENETWPREMAERFAGNGEIFEPVITLHGSNMSAVKVAAPLAGRETETGKPLLDPRKLMSYRVIVTTYETVVNYQHSFAQLVDGRPIWSVIVTDEAQRYKELNTRISVAMKAIPAGFHIASTGTPVENRLLDLWNIVDTFQPALLGTASDFTKKYEGPLGQGEGPQRIALESLRGELHFGTPKAFLMRRDKSELRDLLPKLERRIECPMSREEHDAQAACLETLRQDGPPGRHLAVLQRLALLSQHPFLTTEGIPLLSTDELVRTSAKLQAVLSILEEIRASGEKAIIFSRHVAAQNLLALVISEQMGIRVPIINGTMAGTPDSRRAGRTSQATRRTRDGRKRVLDAFREASGFGAIVLSPFVAGVGLTITEANHVIHYGRWWNPAVEAQATDRAHRIGQKRPVTVYYPLLTDPWGYEGASFDLVLDRLLTRKRTLARDFLQPMSDEESTAGELRADLLGASELSRAGAPILQRADINRLSSQDCEALVAALLQREGYHAILTCHSGDGGADVLAIRRGDAVIVQVKRVREGGVVGVEALEDVLAGLDNYRPRLPGTLSGLLVTTGDIPSRVRQAASGSGIALIDGNGLEARVEKAGLTLADVLAASSRRCAVFEDGVQAAREAMRG